MITNLRQRLPLLLLASSLAPRAAMHDALLKAGIPALGERALIALGILAAIALLEWILNGLRRAADKRMTEGRSEK